MDVKFTFKTIYFESMSVVLIGLNISNIDTGELLAHNVKEYELDSKDYIKRLHILLDSYIDVLKNFRYGDKEDNFSFEFRSYRSHKDLELPF